MFPSPDNMVHEYMDRIAQKVREQEMIEDLIAEYKADALFRIGKICDMFYVEAIALTIASGYENEDESAIEIVNRLSLNDKHIAGILGDSHMMDQILMDEGRQHEQDQCENETFGEE